MSDLLTVENLDVQFRTQGRLVHAVRGVSFKILSSETVAIVGESGSGKSATAKALVQLLPEHTTLLTGVANYQGQNLITLSEQEMQRVRGKEIGMIFQDPMTSLNPTTRIGQQILEGILRHFPLLSKDEARKRALELLQKVGISHPEERFDAYPFTLSGGMRQRVMIAISLACHPRLLIADEPTTALDVTIQAQILDLLKQIQQELRMGILLITHDLSIVARFCDRVMVMYGGKIVESAPIDELFYAPKHPYTQKLLQAIPRLHQPKSQPLNPIEGVPPNLALPLKGCAFCARCDQAMRICAQEVPTLSLVGQEHLAACHKYDSRAKTGAKTEAQK